MIRTRGNGVSDNPELDALLEAEEAPAILEALARAVWADANLGNTCPGEAIPTIEQIDAFRPDDATAGECYARMDQAWEVLSTYRPMVAVPLSGRPWGVSLVTIFKLHQSQLADHDQTFQQWAAKAEDNSVSPDRVIESIDDLWKAARNPPCPFCSDLVNAIPDCGICGGSRFAAPADPPVKHPLAPLIAAWQAEVFITVEPDRREDAIGQLGLFAWTGNGVPNVITVFRRHDNDLPVTLGPIRNESQLCLPGIEGAERGSEVIPAPALVLVDAAGFGNVQPGSGARLDKRLAVFSLLHVPMADRRPGGRYTWRPTLRELVHGLLFPAPAVTGTGQHPRSTWKPSRHESILRRAIDALALSSVKLPDRRELRPVLFRILPDFADLDSRAVILIELPEDADVHGFLVRWHPLIAAGVVSDSAFDGALCLAWLWDRAKANNGGFRIYATRPKALRDGEGRLVDAKGNVIAGADPKLPAEDRRKVPRDKPARDWSDSRAVIVGEERHPQADRVPVLNRDDRRRLFYGHGSDGASKNARSKMADRADARLRTIEAQGHVVIEVVKGEGWRVLEPRPVGSAQGG